jgi:hypothetical protein
MSLPVLVAMVVVGIVAIVLAVHLTGGTRQSRLADADAARERFALDFPRERAVRILVTASGHAAFLDLGGERTGIVASLGGHFLTRVVTPADILRVDRPRPDRLEITTADFSWRGGEFVFATPEEAHTVAARLAPDEAAQSQRRLA